MKPKISIITVCYNAELHIEEAILSVVNQNYPKKEYIVIDGGSCDKTLCIIEKYKNKIDYVITEPDEGISDAFNKGIKIATGDIIGICNSDDMLNDNALLEVSKVYESGIDVYRFPEIILNPIDGKRILVHPTNIPSIPIQTHLLHMGCFITSNGYNKFGMYDKEYKYCMDYELIRRFISKGARFKYCDYPVGIFRLGGISQSNNKKINNEKISICKKYGGGYVGGYIWVIYDYIKMFMKQKIKYMTKRVK